MTQRDQLPGALSRLNRSNASHSQDIALGRTPLQHQLQNLGLHGNAAFCGGATLGAGSITHLHHVHLTAGVEVAQAGLDHPIELLMHQACVIPEPW